MILFRYLAKEVGMTLIALTSILVLIFMSNQLMLYLNGAVNGRIPGTLVMQLMLLEMPGLLSLLLPLGFYFAVLVAYGRLYADSEMVVMQACGYSSVRLLMHTLYMAAIVAAIIAVMISFNPEISQQRTKLMQTRGLQTLIQTIAPGQFRSVKSGQYVFFVESMNSKHNQAQGVFVAKRAERDGKLTWDVLVANRALTNKDSQTKEEYVILKEGHYYQGNPGDADYQLTSFDQYEARLPHQTVAAKKDIRTFPFNQLLPWNNLDFAKAAELQWRISIPLMAFTLAFIGVPLSRVNPRSGKYAKLLPGVIFAFVYADFMFVVRGWLNAGTIPIWLGMWWLHAMVILIGLGLMWRQRLSGL